MSGSHAGAWDQQNIDLASAAGLIGGAGTAGFTAAVSGPASRFTSDWQRFTDALATRCETRADGLRATIETYLQTELTVQHNYVLKKLHHGRRGDRAHRHPGQPSDEPGARRRSGGRPGLRHRPALGLGPDRRPGWVRHRRGAHR